MQKKKISKHQQFHNAQFLFQLLLLLFLIQVRIETDLHLLNLVLTLQYLSEDYSWIRVKVIGLSHKELTNDI